MFNLSNPNTRAYKVIGIVGSRRRDSNDDYLLLIKAFEKIWKIDDRLVSGGCPQGADRTGGTEDTIKKADKFGKTLVLV